MRHCPLCTVSYIRKSKEECKLTFIHFIHFDISISNNNDDNYSYNNCPLDNVQMSI